MNNLAPSMVTLEQARVLDALARTGTLQAAAKALAKGHPAVLYTLRTLEDAVGLELLDRSGYRLKLTPAGTRVLEALRELLEAEKRVRVVVHEVKTGWEPRLGIVVDGVCPTAKLYEVFGRLATSATPTKIDVITEFLSGVEAAFEEQEAHLMISVLPVSAGSVVATPLPAFDAYLVASKRHALAGRKRLSQDDLGASVLLTVKGSDPRLSLPTAGLEAQARVVLNDFASKKTAILAGAGFGWLPEHLIDRELARGELVRLAFSGGSKHAFAPRLYRRRKAKLGRAGLAVFDALTA